MHAIKRTVVEAQTKFQHVEIMETTSYGKVLILDGRIQSSQADEFIYHEALVHPGLLATDGAPRSALVIGGREGPTPPAALDDPSFAPGALADLHCEGAERCKQRPAGILRRCSREK